MPRNHDRRTSDLLTARSKDLSANEPMFRTSKFGATKRRVEGLTHALQNYLGLGWRAHHRYVYLRQRTTFGHIAARRASLLLASATILSVAYTTVSRAASPSPAPDGRPISALPAVIETRALPDPGPNGFWDYVSVDTDVQRLFIGAEDGVMSVDLTTGAAKLLVPERLVHTVLALPEGRALSTNGESDTATVFDARSGHVFGSVPTGKHPDGAVYDAATGLVLVMDAMGGDITLIDPRAVQPIGRIDLGTQPEAAAGDGKGTVYVNLARKDEIAVVDVASRSVVARYRLPDCHGPTGLALDHTAGLLVSACEDSAVVLQAALGRLVTYLTIGGGADAVIFDPRRKTFFVPCGDDGSLVAIAERPGGAPKVVATIKTAQRARTGAIDLATGRLYLPTADASGDTVEIEGFQAPRSRPGTFRLVVVATEGVRPAN